MTQRDRIVVGVLATLAVLAGFWFLLLAPRKDEASKAAAQVQAEQDRVDAARAKLSAAEAAKNEYNKQVLTIARLGKAVPPSEDVPSLIYQLERTAREAGIDFRSFKIEQAATPAAGSGADAAQATGGLTPMPFKIQFRGEFLELRKFMDKVQSFAKPKGDTLDVKGRLMTVDGISIGPDGNVFPNVTAELVVTAYSAPAAEAKPGATTGTTPGTATPSSSEPAPAPTASSGSTTPPPAIVGGLLP